MYEMQGQTRDDEDRRSCHEKWYEGGARRMRKMQHQNVQDFRKKVISIANTKNRPAC